MAAKKPDVIKGVAGTPAKNFFVNMLTRDIELHDAILDLLDNCVDGALRTLNDRPKGGKLSDDLSGFWAHITLTPEKFTIEDNCGGIPWKIAESYAFRMGRPKEFEKPEGTIGMVGIGMKRAIFKLGRECYVHSHHRKDSFMVTVPETWFEEDNLDWNFPAEREEKPISKNYGTIIEISALNDPVILAFQKGSKFRADFGERIGESYSYLIDRGFKITVNGEKVKRKELRIFFEDPNQKPKWGGLIQPYIFRGKIGKVDVFFAVGYRSAIQTEEELNAQREGSFAEKDAGWTVVCNDRVVLSNDRSILTGWGFAGVPAFHTQFSAIAGIVEFSSENTFDLPLTTTKRGLESSKGLYTIVRNRMQEATKYFTRHTNRWKGRENELKEHFRRLEKDEQEYDLDGLRKMARHVEMSASKNMPGCRLFKPNLPYRDVEDDSRRITFVKPIPEISAVSQHLFDEERSPGEVGQACFEQVHEETTRKK
jgi:hypothetical protein